MSHEASPPLDLEVAIETPEHIVFHYRLAGPARRAVAHVLDLAVCYGAVAILAGLLLVAHGGRGIDAVSLDDSLKAGVGVVLLVLFAVQWLYFLVWEARAGWTPGKIALGLRVVTTSGRPIGWSAAALRNLLRAVDVLPVGYAAGVLAASLSPSFQRIGDLVAGTIVIAPERAQRRTNALELSPPATDAELATVPEEVLLDVEERAAIELFLRRRGSLGAARERELAEMIARPLGDRLGYAHADPARLLAVLYDRAVNAGRADAPASLPPSRVGSSRDRPSLEPPSRVRRQP